MARIEWSESWSVGEPRLDQEHKGLVNLINRLLDGEGCESETARRYLWHEAINELVHYIENHFRYEERVMAEAHYPDLEEHKTGHMRFRKQVAHLAANQVVAPEDFIELHTFLSAWLKHHILADDRLYAPYVRASQAEA